MKKPGWRVWGLSATVFVGVVAVSGVSEVSGAGPQDTFEESSSVLVVEVPVRVLIDGIPLRGLGADDFEVWDGGVRRQVTGFEALDFSVGAEFDPGAETRNFLFLVDLAYGGAGAGSARRRLEETVQALRNLVEEGMGPSDRLGIAYFSAVRGVKLLLDFTNDGDRLRRALGALELIVSGESERLRQEVTGWAELGPARWGGKAKTARGPIRPNLEDLVAEARQFSFRGDQELPHSSLIMHLTRGLREISRRTNLLGEKHLVLLSAGPLYGEDVARSLYFIQQLFRDFQQENWSVQSINIAGLGLGRSSLHYLAEGTGGELFTNSRDVDRLLRDMVQNTSVGYVLAFQVDNPKADGRYRELRVQLRDAPDGTKLVHRPGYFAPGRSPDALPGLDLN